MITYYVDCDAAGGDDGSVGSPYDSLANAEAARNGTFTDAVTFVCLASGGGKDTDACVWSGGTQTPTYYALIEAAAAHYAGVVWDEAKYGIVLTSTPGNPCLDIGSSTYIKVRGIQTRIVSKTDNYAAGIIASWAGNTSNKAEVKDCLFIGDGGTSYTLTGFGCSHADWTVDFINCLAFNIGYDGNHCAFVAAGVTNIYNCVAVGGGTAARIQGTAVCVMKNCYFAAPAGSGITTYTGCTLDKVNVACSDTTATATGTGITATNCIDNVPLTTATFVDPLNATALSRDFHFADVNSDLYGAGVAPGGSAPLDYTTDLDGETVGTWCIGVDSVAAAGGAPDSNFFFYPYF